MHRDSHAALRPDRRRVERYLVPSAITPVALRPLDVTDFILEGHAINLSEAGVLIELDRPLDPGTAVALRLHLPGMAHDAGPGRAVFLIGRVIWARLDEDRLGPSRLAVAFTRWTRQGDLERLRAQLATGRFRRAA